MVSFMAQKPNSLLMEPKTGVLNVCFEKIFEVHSNPLFTGDTNLNESFT